MFNLNLRYILTKISDLNNQNNALYKVSFIKLMNIMRSNNFVTKKSRDKLWGLVPDRIVDNLKKISFNILLKLYLNKQKDLIGIRLFVFIVNIDM